MRICRDDMQPSDQHIVIIAGEESGDQHAAQLVQTLKAKYPHLKISGIGGQHMQAAGVELLSDLARFGVTGIIEVFRHGWMIYKAYQIIKKHLKKTKPDLLILVDYPGFNLRLAQFAKKLNLKILYYISPQIWAWKARRIETIRKCIDHMAVILPFEKEIYQHAKIPVAFVGHPLTASIEECIASKPQRTHYQLPENKKIIALLPGSRVNEIERHMPVLYDTAKKLIHQHPDLHFVIPIAKTIAPSLIKSYWSSTSIPCSFIEGNAVEIAWCSDAVVVASGTASLECALLAKPMCIIYKASLITYLAASQLIRVKYLGLCNLLQNEMIVPELLQYDCNPKELTQTINSLLFDTATIQRMQTRLTQLKHNLSLETADMTLCELVEHLTIC